MNPVVMPWIDNREMTQTAIYDVLEQTLSHVVLLTIDQGSRDGEWLRTWSPPGVLQWKHDPPLPSLGATWNRALRWAWESGAEHCLVVNNDIRLPRGVYEALLAVQQQTGAWFVSAVNVGEAWYDGMLRQCHLITDSLLQSRGGPDFSCFLITKACHEAYTFDECFIPAYCEDCSYHRRLMLGGDGDKIFSVCVPYFHHGSGTLKGDARLQDGWGAKFARCKEVYREMWGGYVNDERFTIPWDPASALHGVTNPELQAWVQSGRDIADLLNGLRRG